MIIDDKNTTPTDTNQGKIESVVSGFVGLSYNANLTATNDEKPHYDLQFNTYQWGESDVRIKPAYNVNTNEQRGKPPKREGERVQQQLSARGKRRLKKAARFYQYLAESRNKKRGYATMITLSYGKQYADDRTAKKMLDIFIKRLRRVVKAEDFHYCWVAERQKRGAIHFHILTPEYVPKNWINENWNSVVNGYWEKHNQHEKIQTLYPNVIAVYNAGAYLVKYLQKQGQNIAGNGYNMSQATSQAIKPTVMSVTHLDEPTTVDFFNKIEVNSRYTFVNEYVAIQWLPPKYDQWIKEQFQNITIKHNATTTTNKITIYRRQPCKDSHYNFEGIIRRKKETTRILQT